jgi:hypothetical protein
VPETDGGAPSLRAIGADGTIIEIRELYLVIYALEVHRCVEARSSLERLSPISEAHAHVPSSATRLGIPVVVDLLGRPGRARAVGEIAPPTGTYCKLYAIVAPADEDAMNPTRVARDAIAERSLLVRGRWRPARAGSETERDAPDGSDDGDGWRPFTLSAAPKRAVDVPLLDPRSGEAPLALSEPGDSAFVLLDLRVGPEIFAGLDPRRFDSPEIASTIVDRLAEKMQIHRFSSK